MSIKTKYRTGKHFKDGRWSWNKAYCYRLMWDYKRDLINEEIDPDDCFETRLFAKPGCCGIAVFIDLPQIYDKEDEEIFDKIVGTMKEVAKKNNYGMVECEVVKKISKEALEKNGFFEINSFKNPRSDNTVYSMGWKVE